MKSNNNKQHTEENSKQKREDEVKYDTEFWDSQDYLCSPGGYTLQICDRDLRVCMDAQIGFRYDEDTFKLSDQFENPQSQDIE